MRADLKQSWKMSLAGIGCSIETEASGTIIADSEHDNCFYLTQLPKSLI
jgi:hypothetical protein